MKTILHIIRFELTYLSRKPVFYSYLITYFLFGLVMILGPSGIFDSGYDQEGSIKWINAPFEISTTIQFMIRILIFFVPSVTGLIMQKDFSTRTFSILFSYPLHQSQYLAGKWLSSFIAILWIVGSGICGLLLGEYLLGQNHPAIGPTSYHTYFQAVILFALPNLILALTMVVIIVGLFRTIYPAFIAVMILFLLQIILDNALPGLSNVSTYLDYFGQQPFLRITEMWTQVEKNNQLIPWTYLLWTNRIVWLLVALCAYLLFNKKFQLTFFPISDSGYLFLSKDSRNPENPPELRQVRNILPVLNFTFPHQFRLFWRLLLFDIKYILSKWSTYLFMAFGLLAVFFAIVRVTNSGEFVYQPLTRILLSVPSFFYINIVILYTFILTAQLVFRKERSGMAGFIHSSFSTNTTELACKIQLNSRYPGFVFTHPAGCWSWNSAGQSSFHFAN